MPTLVLASQSPARLETLRRAGIEPVVVVSGVDEDQLGDLPPAELALQLADVQFSNGFRFEGLHFIARVRSGFPRCRITTT